MGVGLVELSVFCDEAGNQNMEDGYYLLTLVIHEQDDPIGPAVEAYESLLSHRCLPNIPFHMKDLLHGHIDYEKMKPEERKRLLTAFSGLVRNLPIGYKTFSYSSFDTSGKNLSVRMRRDIVNFAYDNLAWFQSFDSVPVFYDEGQAAVTDALHGAFDLILSDQAIDYRHIAYRDYRLAQAADYFCSVERIANVYDSGDQTPTLEKFFGNRDSFKRNYLKQARRKVL